MPDVYGWIWRHLPFGLGGKVIGSILLSLATLALLWYVVFPAVDPLLPFNNDGQVSTQNGPPSQGGTQTDQPDQDSVVPVSPSATN